MVAPHAAGLCSDQSVVGKGGRHKKLEEMLNHTIEMSDLLPESKCQSEESINNHSNSLGKVVHISTHDFGGAGKAAYHLHKGLQKIGVETTMLVMNKKCEDPSVKVFPEKFSANCVTCKNSKNNYSAFDEKKTENIAEISARAFDIFVKHEVMKLLLEETQDSPEQNNFSYEVSTKKILH